MGVGGARAGGRGNPVSAILVYSNGNLNVSVLVAMWSTLTMGRKPVMKVMRGH